MSTIGGRLHGAVQPLCSFCVKILSHTRLPALTVYVQFHSSVSGDHLQLYLVSLLRGEMSSSRTINVHQ